MLRGYINKLSVGYNLKDNCSTSMSCKHIESFLYSSQQHKRNNIPHKYNLNRVLILSHNDHKNITFLPACNLHLSVSPEIHSAYLLSAAKERPRFLDSASDPSTYIWDYRLMVLPSRRSCNLPSTYREVPL